MRKVAAYLYKGPIVGVNEYLDIEEFDVEEWDVFNSEYVPSLDKLLARNGMDRDFYFVKPGPGKDEFCVDFGLPTYFIVVRFVGKIKEKEEV